jgi:signal transduction histidine kinase/ActR/RegA family two-component response regulator
MLHPGDTHRAMLEALPCGVVVTTLDGIIRQSNQEFLQWVGESGKVGQPLAGVFTLGSRLFYETNLAPIVHLQGRVDEAVAELRMPDGARMSARLNIREWKGEPDSEPGLLIVVFPANERRRYERELLAAERQSRETAVALRKAREAAEAANEAKTRFLTNMSHELRTPLNGILGFAGLLHDSPLSHPQREYVETIQQSGEGLLDIISDLLDLARVTSGRMELENVAVELQKVMTGVCDLVTPRLIDTSTKLTIEWDNSLPQYLWGDPGRIRQILLNLVGNAIKFTEAGTVTVHARRADPGIVRIEVADSGPGIAPEYRDRIFESFDRGDPTVAMRQGGTGLGLAIARELTEAMGGAIGVESQVGVGSIFWFTLPLRTAAVEPEEAPAVADEPQPSGGTYQVLLAEDNVINRRLATVLLEKLGCEVVTAADGVEALDFSQRTAFDLIILDCMMPQLDGWQAARQMREAGLTTPIVALTASAMPADRQRCQEAGMDAFLTKPVRQAELAAALRQYAGTKRLGQPS